MLRRSVARLVLLVSLAAGTVAWAGFVSLNTVLDPDRSRDVADALYEDDAVRDRIADNLAAAARRAVPDEAGVTDEQIQSAARAALASPAVGSLVVDSLVAVHQGFLGRGEIPKQIDAGAVGVAARASLVEARPELDGVLPPAPELTIPLPTERIPNARPLRTALSAAVPVLALAALGGIVLALVFTNDRPSILRSVGIRAIVVSAVCLVIALGLPRLAEALAPDQAEIVAALVGALMRSTLTPALVLAGCGLAAVAAATLWKRVPGDGAARSGGPVPERRGTQASRPANRLEPPARRDARSRPAQRPAARRPPSPQGNQNPPRDEPWVPRPQPQPSPSPSPLSSHRSAPGLTRLTRWVDGVGWVVDPDEPEIPASARWVPGVGYVVDTPEG